jgi:phosphoribosylformylglycinamidine synthase
MAFSGNLGADLQLTACPTAESLTDAELLYSESPTRFVLEVPTGLAATVEGCLAGLPHAKIGVVVSEPRFRVAGQHGEWVIWSSLAELKKAWQEPFRM